MQSLEIVNTLKQLLPKYTDSFSSKSQILSLSRNGATITANIPNHNLKTGDYTTIEGAKEVINISSATRVDNIVYIQTAEEHNLLDPSKYSLEQAKKLFVEIQGMTPSDYNGEFKLLSVSDRNNFTYKINTTESDPSVLGRFLQSDYDGYNGYKQITKIDNSNISYETSDLTLGNTEGEITINSGLRVQSSATLERAIEFYSSKAFDKLDNWLFVVVGDKVAFKNGETISDTDITMKSSESYYYQTTQELSLYVFIPTKSDIVAGNASDKARILEKAILKSIANRSFTSHLTECEYNPLIYTGSGTEDYNLAYYIHRYNFITEGKIQQEDTADYGIGTIIRTINAPIPEKNKDIQINF